MQVSKTSLRKKKKPADSANLIDKKGPIMHWPAIVVSRRDRQTSTSCNSPFAQLIWDFIVVGIPYVVYYIVRDIVAPILQKKTSHVNFYTQRAWPSVTIWDRYPIWGNNIDRSQCYPSPFKRL